MRSKKQLKERLRHKRKVFEFVKMFVWCCRGHFYEAVYDAFPSVILDEAFDS